MIASFKYRNHRGEQTVRTVDVAVLEFILKPGYGYQPGWFLSGICLDRGEYRSFALSHITFDAGLASYVLPLDKKVVMRTPGTVEIHGVTVRTDNHRDFGQDIVVSVALADGTEVDVIREFGALPDVSIHHNVTSSGIDEARSRKVNDR